MELDSRTAKYKYNKERATKKKVEGEGGKAGVEI